MSENRMTEGTLTDECTCGGACRGGPDERLAPAPVHNPPGRTALDYRVGEYGSFLSALLDRLASPAYPALSEAKWGPVGRRPGRPHRAHPGRPGDRPAGCHRSPR